MSADSTHASGDQGATSYILVIDDERAVREAVTDILELENLPALTAKDGQTGVDLLLAHKGAVQLILLDMSMPGMNGIETLKALRQIDQQVPILITSGFNKSFLDDEIDERAISGFIPKPFTFDKLIKNIRQHL